LVPFDIRASRLPSTHQFRRSPHVRRTALTRVSTPATFRPRRFHDLDGFLLLRPRDMFQPQTPLGLPPHPPEYSSYLPDRGQSGFQCLRTDASGVPLPGGHRPPCTLPVLLAGGGVASWSHTRGKPSPPCAALAVRGALNSPGFHSDSRRRLPVVALRSGATPLHGRQLPAAAQVLSPSRVLLSAMASNSSRTILP